MNTEQVILPHANTGSHESQLNKENSKNINECIAASKQTLKPREFGRDVTNNACAQSNKDQNTVMAVGKEVSTTENESALTSISKTTEESEEMTNAGT